MFMRDAKHEFALYVPELYNKAGSCAAQCTFELDDADLVHRLVNVLRLAHGERCVLFDRQVHVVAEFIESTKKGRCTFRVYEWKKNQIVEPRIQVLLPMLKREALEQALYSCVELGATDIQLITTEKTHAHAVPHERLEKIVIAAAEQSKNFAFPKLFTPQSLETVLKRSKTEHVYGVFFDVDGVFAQEMIQRYRQHTYAHISMVVGPEGDFTAVEKELLRTNGMLAVKLTPTVLRSQQAVAVGLGILRSFM